MALGLLGFLYVNNKKDEENKTGKKESFESKPKMLQVQSEEVQGTSEQRTQNLFNRAPIKKRAVNETYINQQFSGGVNPNSKDLSKENFLMDDTGMVPRYYERDNTIEDPNQERLMHRENRMFQALSGKSEYNYKKTESRPFFKPTKDLSHVNGAPNINEYEKDRLHKSNTRRGELPFDQIRVGPGLGKEYGNTPSGGFHQQEIQDIIRPKNIDQLRTKNNQHISYKGVVIKGKSVNNKRKHIGSVSKRRPETYYTNSEERYFKTTGAVLKDNNRLNFDVDEKPTNRTISRAFIGHAKSDKHQPKLQPNVKKTTKNNYKHDGVRNIHSKQTWSSVEKISDYGKHTFTAYPNERDVTQQRTTKSNLSTYVKAIIAPILDKFKKTKKENVEGNIRPEGNLSMAVPSKPTVYDPNDIAKTTIKETTIHNKREGNLKSIEKNTVYEYDTLPKITIRNTLDTVDTNLNIGTITPKLKQFSNQPIKATIKQTTIEQKNHGQPAFKKGAGYLVKNATAPNTNRQFTSNHKYTGIAGSKNKQPQSYVSSYNASLNINKELISKGRAPTNNGAKKSIGKQDVNIIHKKKMAETKTRRPRSSVKISKGKTPVQLSTFRDHAYIDNSERNNGELLTPLKNNPYHIQNAGKYDYPDTEITTKPDNYTPSVSTELSMEQQIQNEINKL